MPGRVVGVLRDAGLVPELAEALYAVESDLRHNPFAEDAAPVLRALHDAGARLAVLSDIPVDVRPAFDAAGLLLDPTDRLLLLWHAPTCGPTAWRATSASCCARGWTRTSPGSWPLRRTTATRRDARPLPALDSPLSGDERPQPDVGHELPSEPAARP